jgi:hypothetical protein
MKLPNWFKIVWWLLLLLALTVYLGERYPELRSGHSIPMDVVVFLVWVGLLLAPLFQEIGFWGLTLKQQLEGLKSDVRDQVQSLKSEIQNVVQVSPNITIVPPSDSQLPAIEREVRRVLSQVIARDGVNEWRSHLITALPSPSNDVMFLIEVRVAMESELRNIARRALNAEAPIIISRLVDILTKGGILNSELGNVIRQVYAVCSPAVHGLEVSAAKVRFVREVAPDLITALKRLGETAELHIGEMKVP